MFYDRDGLRDVTTPGGGHIHYDYQDWSQPHPDYLDGQEPYYHGRFLSARTVSGSDVMSGTWVFDHLFFPSPADGPPTYFTLTSPSGITAQFTHCEDVPQGEVWIVGGGSGTCYLGTPERQESHIHRPGVFIDYGNEGSGAQLWMYYREESAVFECFETPCTTIYKTEYFYDDFQNIIRTREYNTLTPGVERNTYHDYFTLPGLGGGPYFSLLAREKVQITGEPTPFVTFERGFNSVTGFMEAEVKNFLEGQIGAGVATGFIPTADGNVASATTNGKTTNFTYSWGQVATIQTPEGVNTTRVINPDGAVHSETQAGRTTTYEYDLLGRKISTQGPGGTLPTLTDYASNGREVTTTRGSSRVRTTLDNFGRPILTESGDTTAYHTQTATHYDAEGRKTFEGLPVAAGASDVGTALEYDGFGRLQYERHADGSVREHGYGHGVVALRDEQDHLTFYTRQLFGTPEDGWTKQVNDPTGFVWLYAYNGRGNLTSVSDTADGLTREWKYNAGGQLQSETHPESGKVEYTQYNPAGVLTEKVDANGTSFTYGLDDNNRIRTITATQGGTTLQSTAITYEPGSDLRKTATVDGITSVFDYDTAGRLHQRTDTVDGKDFVVVYDYDTRDNLTGITYPTGRHVTIDYDTENRIQRVANGLTDETYATDFQYEPSGALNQYRAGNGVLTTLTYDPQRQWLNSLVVGTGATRLDFGYSYDPVGNITDIVDHARAEWNQHFDYDALDRLTSAAAGSYGTLAYTYDPHGNRQTANGGVYSYDPSNLFRLQHIDGGLNLTYDSNGNLTGGFGGTYAYTPTNQASTATVNGVTTQYAYDIDQWRLKKAVGSDPVVYAIRGPNGQLLSEWTNSAPTATVRDYIYAGGRLIGVMTTHQPAK
jgi:YD repeat-containing protein